MNNFDYSDTKKLFEKYKERFFSSFTPLQKDLADELLNKLNDLDEVSMEIVELVSNLFSNKNLSPDENDIVNLGPFKIKLKRADPNIPIKLDNATKAYSRGTQGIFSVGEITKTERKLERITAEFYKLANRITHITENLPNLSSFKCKTIRIIRNKLIEHPEGKESGITHDSFSYSKNEGPYIKGLRKGNQTQYMDQGFKKNSEEFILKFKESIQQALV